jgi:hypothetical protein
MVILILGMFLRESNVDVSVNTICAVHSFNQAKFE